MFLPLLAAASLAAGTTPPAQQLAYIDSLLFQIPEPPTECSCTLERTDGEDTDVDCGYAYSCTNQAEGETRASCNAAVALAQVTEAICNPQ